MVQSRILMAFVVLFLLLFYVYSDLYFALFALVTVLALLFASWSILFFSRNKVKTTINADWSTYKNEVGIMHVHLENTSIFPLLHVAGTLTFTNKLTAETYYEQIMMTIPGKGTSTMAVQMQHAHIGSIHVAIHEVTIYDYFNLFSFTQPISAEVSILNLPIYFPIYFTETAGGYHLEDTPSLYRDIKGQDGLEITGLKEYEPGENAKGIHWKLTSKFDQPILKEWDDPVENKILILYETTENETAEQTTAKTEAFVSLSHALLLAQYDHALAWFDHATNTLKIEKVFSEAHLLALQPTILSMSRAHRGTTSLGSLGEYMSSTENNRYSRLFYICSSDLVVEEDAMTMLRCVPEKEKQTTENYRKVMFTPETIEEDLQQLII